jgi:hypothetical protein
MIEMDEGKIMQNRVGITVVRELDWVNDRAAQRWGGSAAGQERDRGWE